MCSREPQMSVSCTKKPNHMFSIKRSLVLRDILLFLFCHLELVFWFGNFKPQDLEGLVENGGIVQYNYTTICPGSICIPTLLPSLNCIRQNSCARFRVSFPVLRLFGGYFHQEFVFQFSSSLKVIVLAMAFYFS